MAVAANTRNVNMTVLSNKGAPLGIVESSWFLAHTPKRFSFTHAASTLFGRTRLTFSCRRPFTHERVCYRSVPGGDPQDYSREPRGQCAGDSHRKPACAPPIVPPGAAQDRATV